jgi:site-specific DNA-cytosine methylase
MDRDALISAMKYGSPPRPSPSSLGKFGLGLKTASTAFCRRLSVISRADEKSPLIRATWDLDHVKEANKWELIVEEPTAQQLKDFEKIIGNKPGTMVVWENVDRVLRKNSSAAWSAQAKKALTKVAESLEDHLAMVYQRFLDPKDQRARTINIGINGKQLNAWDPFCVGESELVAEDERKIEISNDVVATFTMKAYVLPRKEEFSSPEAAKEARVSNANQGLYIYRENRLIHGPDWLVKLTKEPHFSLLRVEFSFDHKLDEAFQIDIKKSQIILNETLYDYVLDFLTPPRRHAEEVYRRGTKIKTAQLSKSAHDSSNRNISTKEDQISMPALQSVDAAKNEAEIVNKQGPVKLKLKISAPTKPNEVHVQPVPSIDDGLLWEPCLIDKHYGVRLNTAHPYYHKVYLPNLAQGVTVQGMDALLWGMAVAELNCISEQTKNTFSELRYEVSRNLRKLVEDLPEPDTEK